VSRLLAVATLAAAPPQAAAGAWWLSGPPGITAHGDGGGPLASTGDPTHVEMMGVIPNGSRWTWGYRLCLLEGSAAVIDTVQPAATLGKFDFLGARVRRFAPTGGHMPIISVDGYPPDLPDETTDAAGFTVYDRCDGWPTAGYTELLIGLGLDGTAGGGWSGIEVAYHVGSHRYVLELKDSLAICGPAAASICLTPPPPRAPLETGS